MMNRLELHYFKVAFFPCQKNTEHEEPKTHVLKESICMQIAKRALLLSENLPKLPKT